MTIGEWERAVIKKFRDMQDGIISKMCGIAKGRRCWPSFSDPACQKCIEEQIKGKVNGS